MAFPTMYEHDCISNITEIEPQLRSRMGQVFEPLRDHIQREIEDLTSEEQAALLEWMQGRS